MRRAFAIALAALGIAWVLEASSVGCWVRGQMLGDGPIHDPRRAGAMGGYRCSRCGKVGASLDAFGESGHVSPNRPLYSRDGAGGHQETTRAEWGS